MSRDLSWFELRWPQEVDPGRLVEVFRLLASSKTTPTLIEAVGTDTGVVHRIALPRGRAGMLVEQISAALPAIGFTALPAPLELMVDRAVELRLGTNERPLRAEAEPISRALLGALASPRRGESLVLQWHLVGVIAPHAIGSGVTRAAASDSLVSGFLHGSDRLDADARSALRAKRSQPGWRLVGRIGVHAGQPARQVQLLQHVIAALRLAEAPGVHLRFRSIRSDRLVERTVPWRTPVRLNASELATISSFPAGDTRGLPVARSVGRPLPPTKPVRTTGRVLGQATYPGRERPVALGVDESLRGLHVLGPTGTGKSTLLLRLICQDMAAGRPVVVVEPKGDLIADVLARVPAGREHDIVLVDPTDREAVVGINPLASRSPELAADQLLGVFHRLYASSWGPRTSDILFASLLTLAHTPGMSLAALPLLLADSGFRRRVVGQLDEPVVLQPFWQIFETWGEAQRTEAIAPVLNKVRPLLVRSALRAVLGQSAPRFDLRSAFTERRILLVNLAKGQLGPEAAALLGSVTVSHLWQTALERSTIPIKRRHPALVFIDEFQDYLSLPVDLGDALAQARGLGVGLTLAHQHLGQLSPSMRSAVLANARSRVVFQLGADDARTIASDTPLTPDDLRSLPAFEAFTQLVAGDAVQPWLSLRTLSASQPTSDPDRIRRLSRQQYGTPLAGIDRDLHRLRDCEREDDLGAKRRTGAER